MPKINISLSQEEILELMQTDRLTHLKNSFKIT